ncbi:hypothetical protein KAW65_05295 [candidate division WOR-3 bacterium]|nr:hypothetical protein [candidate division WOR-3 bacterium]
MVNKIQNKKGFKGSRSQGFKESRVRGFKAFGRLKPALLAVLLLIFGIVGHRLSTSYGAGGTAGQYGAFLTYWGCGARSLGMAGALSGLADDASAGYFNPAGLAQINTHELTFMHSVVFAGTGTSFDALMYGCPATSTSGFGTTLLQLYTPGIKPGSKSEIKKPFSDRQVAWLLTYSGKLLGPIYIGINGKAFYHEIATYSALGGGADVGLFLFPQGKFSLGISCQNVIRPEVKLISEKIAFPITLRSGISIRPYRDKLSLAVDMIWAEYRSPQFGFGIEYRPFNILHLRGGINQVFAGFGFGICQDRGRFVARLDYACELPYSTEGMLLPGHNVSLSLLFGGFRARAHSPIARFSPVSGEGENVAWLYLDIVPRSKIKNWQVLIKDEAGTVVRKIGAWGESPYRIAWDGKDDNTLLVPDGRYYYSLTVVEKKGRVWESEGFLTTLSTVGPPGTIIVKPKGETPEFILEQKEEKEVEPQPTEEEKPPLEELPEEKPPEEGPPEEEPGE